MKIGYVLDDRLDVADGVQQYVKTIGSWMAEQGHEVHYLVGQNESDDDKRIHGLGKTVKLRFNKNRVRIPLPANKTMLRNRLAQEKFDILHVQMPYAPWLAGRVINAAPPATAVVGTFHVVVASPLVESLSPLLRIVYNRSLKRMADVVAVSAPANRYMQVSMGRSGTVVPNAVNVGAFAGAKKRSELDDGKTNIVFLGRLVERKGAEHLIRAYQQVATENTRLVIVGDGPLRPQLEKLAEGTNAVFVGYVEEDEKPSYLASADLAVFPSTGGESFGIVLIEAMSAGAGAVLAGNNEGYSSVLKSIPESLFDPFDTEALQQKIALLVTDNKARKQIHTAQKELVKMFDVNVVGRQLEATYRKALKQ